MENPSHSARWLARLAALAVILAFVVIALGAMTRLTDSGLGCPDWPGCYGHLAAPTSMQAVKQIDQLFPSHPVVQYKAWAEMVHRYFAGTLALLIAVVVFIAWRMARRLHSKPRMVLAMALLLLLLYQPILGMWTVTWKLLPIVVSQHLLGGFGLLAMLWVHYLLYRRPVPVALPAGRTVRVMAVIGLVLLVLQIMLGAWTSTNYAAISCSSFPLCEVQSWHLQFKQAFSLFSPIGANYDGGLLSLDAKRTIQVVHRFGALAVTAYFLVFVAMTVWRYQQYPAFVRLLLLTLGVLFLQVCLGIANVLLARPLGIAILHNLTAATLLLCVVAINVRCFADRPQPLMKKEAQDV